MNNLIMTFISTKEKLEFKIDEIYEFAEAEADFHIIKDSNYAPAVMPSPFIKEINHFGRKKQALFYCLILEKHGLNVFYSPSITLLVNFMVNPESGIKRMLGWYDSTNSADRKEVDYVINEFKKKNTRVKSKGLENILDVKKVNKSYFCGEAGNGNVDSKVIGDYDCYVKQLVTVDGDFIDLPESLEQLCTCKESGFSFVKGEQGDKLKRRRTFRIDCHHLELLKRSYENPLLAESIDNIFNAFTGLKNVLNASPEYRKYVRKGFIQFLKDYWNRVQLDVYLLGNKETYNPKVLKWFVDYYDKGLSQKKTSDFFGEVQLVDVKESKAIHYYNKTKKRWEHRLNGVWWKTEHALKNKITANLWIPFNDGYIEYKDKKAKIQILTHPDNIDDPFVTHDSVTFNHNKPVNYDYEVVHIEKVWKPIFRNHDEELIRVSNLPGNVLMYLGPYQMSKL